MRGWHKHGFVVALDMDKSVYTDTRPEPLVWQHTPTSCTALKKWDGKNTMSLAWNYFSDRLT